MTDKKKFEFNIQLFGGEGGESGGEPTTNQAGKPEPTINTGAGGEPPQPGGEPQGGAGEPTTPEPKLTWDNFNTDNYKDIDVAESILNEFKEKNYSPEFAKIMLESRKAYIEAERNNMSPELKAALPVINNFIESEKNINRQAVYKAMAINVEGAAILKEYMEMKAGSSGSIAGVGAPQKSSTYTHDSFIDAYNEALDTNNKGLMNSLKEYAQSMKKTDQFYWDFIK